jgi:predicted MFS family arabinose efflux permease
MKPTTYPKSIIYILALGVFGIITTEFGIIGILPEIAANFHVSIAHAGWLVTAFALVIAVFGPFVTLAASKLNRKLALSIVLVVFVLSNLLSMLATSFPILMIARILPAFFHPVFFSVAMATAALSAKPGEGPKAVSIVFSGVSIGTVLGVPIVAFFADQFDWKAAFLISSIITGVALVFLLRFLPSLPVNHKLSFESQLSILKKAKTWWSIGVVTLFITGMATSYSYMAEYLKETVKMDGRTVSLALLLFGAAGVFGNILLGRLLTKSIGSAVWSFFTGLIIVQGLLYISGAHLYTSLVLTAIWGFIHTGGFLLGQTLITHSSPEAPEFSSSIFVSTGNLGFSLGSIFGGLALEAIGVNNLPLVSITVLLVAAAAYLLQDRL